MWYSFPLQGHRGLHIMPPEVSDIEVPLFCDQIELTR